MLRHTDDRTIYPGRNSCSPTLLTRNSSSIQIPSLFFTNRPSTIHRGRPTMAFSAKTPAIHLNSERLYHPKSETCKLKPLIGLQKFKNTHFLSSKSKPFSALSTSSIDTHNPNVHLQEFCLNGDLEQALNYLSSMRELQFSVDEDVAISLVKLCEWRRASEEGSRVYSLVLNSCAQLSIRLGNAFLSMFVRLGNLGNAWYVFGRMPERDVFSWNVLLSGYAKAGFFYEALCLYQRMFWAGNRPDVYTFPCVLRTCGGLQDIARGKELHVHVIRFGFEVEVDVVNALITMYVKCGDVVSARKLFDRMPKKDRISWNAIISGYFENGDCVEGLRLFYMMREHSVEPDLMTMTSVISACELLGNQRLGQGIHGYVTVAGFTGIVSVSNSLIDMYASVGCYKDAELIFERMEQRDLVSWTAIISCYASNLLPEKALDTYRKMEQENVIPDEITIATVLSACSSSGQLDIGIKLHELSKRTGLLSYVIVANSLIDMYSKNKCIDKALEVFHSFRYKNVISWTSIILGLRLNNRCFEALHFFKCMGETIKPNSVTLLSVLSACSRIGAFSYGKEIHAHAIRTGMELDGFIPNAILDTYVKCGRLRYARKLFNSQRDEVSAWNIMLSGYAQQGKGRLAMKLFTEMVEASVLPDEISFISLLCAFSRSGMITEGQEYFYTMIHKYGINPNLKHYACVVDLLGRAGKLEDAYVFINKMPMKPDIAIWGALLNACRIHRHFELGEIAAQYIFESDTDSVGYYVLLCEFYADNGKWDEVAKVRKLMINNELTVDPGCSWVEVKGNLHAFLSSDNLHPQMKEINSVLEGFYQKMKALNFSVTESHSLDETDVSKSELFCGHSERYAVVFGLINTVPGTPIVVTKNLYMCQTCHTTIKFISKVIRREISVRDAEHFHHFKDGLCSCGDDGLKKF